VGAFKRFLFMEVDKNCREEEYGGVTVPCWEILLLQEKAV
jgi:hypothetical protein